MNIPKKIILFALIVTICSRCYQKEHREHDQQNAELIRQLNTSDTFVREFFSDKTIKISLQDAEKKCGLDSLSNGFDSVQIRIWYGCVLGQNRLIILSLTSDEWKAEVRELTFHNSEQYYSKEDKFWTTKLDSISQKIKYAKPKSGWNSLITVLFNLEILTLPDLEKIDGLVEKESATDGCGVSMEIATKNIYRQYGYTNPDFYILQHRQAKNMIHILQLLNSEFRIKDEWPSPDLKGVRKQYS